MYMCTWETIPPSHQTLEAELEAVVGLCPERVWFGVVRSAFGWVLKLAMVVIFSVLT